jgi:hypothetical protein
VRCRLRVQRALVRDAPRRELLHAPRERALVRCAQLGELLRVALRRRLHRARRALRVRRALVREHRRELRRGIRPAILRRLDGALQVGELVDGLALRRHRTRFELAAATLSGFRAARLRFELPHEVLLRRRAALEHLVAREQGRVLCALRFVVRDHRVVLLEQQMKT